MRIGFIGLGNMGNPMAHNILKAGHELTVYNRTRSKMESVLAAGAKSAESPRDAALGNEIVCTCVSVPDALRAVTLGDDGAVAGTSPDSLYIDFSTVDPTTSKQMAALCQEKGVECLDAPVSGGVAGAQGGTLTVIVGGPQESFERAQPVFQAVGKNIVHAGPWGAGSTFKLINQILVGVNLAAVFEAFVLAKVAGIDLNLLYQVLSTSAGGSSSMNYAVPDHVIGRDFEGGFTVNMLCKDLDLALQMGKDSHVVLMLPALVRQMYEQAKIAGFAENNVTATILPMERLHGIDEGGKGV